MYIFIYQFESHLTMCWTKIKKVYEIFYKINVFLKLFLYLLYIHAYLYTYKNISLYYYQKVTAIIVNRKIDNSNSSERK